MQDETTARDSHSKCPPHASILLLSPAHSFVKDPPLFRVSCTMYGPRSELVAALTFLRVGLKLSRCASTTAPMALSCGVSTACMCARRPSPDQRPRHVCRAAAYSGGCREVVARPRDNLALSLTARQPRPLGGVVARYRATTSPLIRRGPHP